MCGGEIARVEGIPLQVRVEEVNACSRDYTRYFVDCKYLLDFRFSKLLYILIVIPYSSPSSFLIVSSDEEGGSLNPRSEADRFPQATPFY
jgi:hypothetical protein